MTPPDHLSYFNQAGLRNLAEASGWRTVKVIGDHPIKLNLPDPATNYVAYYEGLAGGGLGRSIEFPGETLAFDEVFGVANYALRRSPLNPLISYLMM